MDAPYGFKHELDPGLFTLDRLTNSFAGRRQERLPCNSPTPVVSALPVGPVYTTLEGSIGEDIAQRSLHVHLHDLTDWAPEYQTSRHQVLETAGVEPPRRATTT